MKLTCLFDSVCSPFIPLCWTNIFRDFALDQSRWYLRDWATLSAINYLAGKYNQYGGEIYLYFV
jgi:hypothetical protein